MSRKSFAIQGDAEGHAMALEVNDQLVSLAESLSRIPEKQVLMKKQLAAASNPFTIAHTLGAVPDSFSFAPYTHAVIFSSDSDRQLWTDKTIILRSSVVSALFDLTLYKY